MSLRVFEQQEPTGPVVAIVADGAGKLVVEQSDLLFDATFLRSGNDLLIVNEAAANLHVPGYFSEGKPADIFDANGAVLRGDLIELMAGPIAPGLYAEIGTTIGASPIGQVETLDGISSVQRVDGTIETLQIGMKIFQKDVLQTEGDATLSVTFADGTIFTLAASSRMIIDELIYDPDGADNAGGFSLIQGSFVFIAGQVAKTGDMEVRTPSSTMGIRGTTVVVEVASDKGIVTSEITLAQDIDGEVGKVELRDIEGNLIANIAETDTKWVVEAVNGGIREIQRDALDELADSILVAEAFAAYRAAESRVDAGDTFVTLTDPTAAEHLGRDGTDNEIDLDVDSIDEPETISPLNEVPDEAEEENFDPFDEGLNLQQDAPTEQPDVVVQGDEDSVGDTAIAGSVARSGSEDAEFALQDGPQNGSAEIGDDGTFFYEPNRDFNGIDRFTYTYQNPDGEEGFGTVVVEVLPVNDAPVAENTALNLFENRFVSGSIAVTDVDGDDLTYMISELPQAGEVLLFQNGNFTFTPNADFIGTDRFSVLISDPDGETTESTITFTVIDREDAPVIITTVEDASRSVVETAEATVVGGTLEANDADAGAVLLWSGSSVGAYGTFSITSDGVWSYTLNASVENGLADGEFVNEVFTATVTDNTGLFDTIDVTIMVTGDNDGPVIQTLPGGNMGSVTEGEEEFETGGQLLAIDPDGGEAGVTWSGTSSAQYGDFTLDVQGAWTYRLDNGLADSLQAGEIITETFFAVAEDAEGATVSQSIEVTVTGTNDQPVVSTRIVFEAVENTAYSGVLTASDVDGASDALTFSLGSFGPQNGAININTDGTFEYIPNAGFVGLDTFEYAVSDADGGRSFARASIVVENDPLGSSTENITIGITTQATEENPAGAITIDIDESDSTSVNLAIALDRSGSIRVAPWELLLDSVRESLEDLSDQFAGSDTSVDVQIITFATDVSTTEIFDINDPALLAAVNPDDLEFVGGQTAWDLAFQKTGDFFFSEPASEPNYLLFVTDGMPSSGRWETPFDALVDETSGYDITVSAFGYGGFFEPGSLDDIDPSAQFLDDPSQLAKAFATTPIFNPDLLSFSVELQNDDGSTTLIADETHQGLVIESTDYELPLATIENIAELLSDSNRINITALFDLDNDPTDSEITLFSSDVIGKADVAQTSEGLAGADLLFGSDAADSMSGGGGNDVIFGFDGNDTLSGGSGVDTLRAGEGDDVILLTTAPELGDAIAGEGGRDTLQLDAVGEINALIAALDISGIEALDMENAQQDTLRFSVEELINFSEDDDTELQMLLSEALPNTRTIYGDGDDQIVVDAQSIYSVEETGTVTDSGGNELTVYAFNGSDGNPLATLGVDSDIEVTTANVVT